MRYARIVGSLALLAATVTVSAPVRTATARSLPEEVAAVPSAVFSGVLRDGDGNPVAGSMHLIDLAGNSLETVSTDASGVFRFEVNQRSYRLVAQAELPPSGVMVRTDSSEEIIDLTTGDVSQDIWLPKVVPAEITVVLDDGTPVVAADLGYWGDDSGTGLLAPMWPGGPEAQQWVDVTCTTDELGVCSIGTVRSDYSSAWRVSIPDGPQNFEFALPATSGESTMRYTVRMPELRLVEGDLYLPDGSASVGSSVSASQVGDGPNSAGGWADADGHFEFLVIPEVYYVSVYFPEAALGVTVEARLQLDLRTADAHLDFTAPTPAPVRLTVLDEHGSPVSGADVRGGGQGVWSSGSEFGWSRGSAPLWPGGPPADVAAISTCYPTDVDGVCAATSFVGAIEQSYRVRGPGGTTELFTVPAITSDAGVDATAHLSHYARYTTVFRRSDGPLLAIYLWSSQNPTEPQYPRTVSAQDSWQSHGLSPYIGDSISGSMKLDVIPGPFRFTFGGRGDLPVVAFSLWDDLTDGDVTRQVTLPQTMDLDVTVTDTDGAPLVGYTVYQPQDDIPWEFGSPEVTGTIMPRGAWCTTDATGTCSAFGMPGSPASDWEVVTPDGRIRWKVPAPALTADGQHVALQVRAASTLPSAGAVGGDVVIAGPSGTELDNVANSAVANGTLAGNETALTGQLTYDLVVEHPGDAADVTLSLPPGSAPTGLYKVVDGELIDFSQFATIEDNVVTLHLVDGGDGDSDGEANGVIHDPVIPVREINTLTVGVVGSGSVRSSSPGIDCGTTCSNEFRSSATVTLVATPSPGLAFTGWSGACSGLGACTVEMDQARSVMASFGTGQTLSVSRTGLGTVSSQPLGIACGARCTRAFPSGTPVQLTATASPGYAFSGWSGACTGSGTCTVTMNQTRSVTANFALASALRVGARGGGSVGSAPSGISCGTTCTGWYLPTDVVTLTPTPDTGKAFAGWSGACSGTGACTVTTDDDRAVFADFAEGRSLDVTASGPGSVTSSALAFSCDAECTRPVVVDTEVTLTAVPDQWSRFTGWSGACSGTGSCTVLMDQVRSVTASFVLRDTMLPFEQPIRVVDTRPLERGILENTTDEATRFAAGEVRRYVVAPAVGVPSGTTLALNIVARLAQGTGWLKAYPCASVSTPAPAVSYMNVTYGVTLANGGLVKTDDTGGLCIKTSVATDVIIDTTGWFPNLSTFRPLAAPVRLLDTRRNTVLAERGVLETVDETSPFGSTTVRRYVAVNKAGIPASGVAALEVNVVAAQPATNGELRLYPCASTSSTASSVTSVTFRAGTSIATNTVVQLDASGGFCVRSTGSTHVVIDTPGWFGAAAGYSSFTSPSLPKRLVDTRAGQRGALETVDTTSPLAGGVTYRYPLAGKAGFPAAAGLGAVGITVTVLTPTLSGNVAIWPCATASVTAPNTSIVNFRANVPISNGTIMTVAPTDGGICVKATSATHITLDTTNWFTR